MSALFTDEDITNVINADTDNTYIERSTYKCNESIIDNANHDSNYDNDICIERSTYKSNTDSIYIERPTHESNNGDNTNHINSSNDENSVIGNHPNENIANIISDCDFHNNIIYYAED